MQIHAKYYDSSDNTTKTDKNIQQLWPFKDYSVVYLAESVIMICINCIIIWVFVYHYEKKKSQIYTGTLIVLFKS